MKRKRRQAGDGPRKQRGGAPPEAGATDALRAANRLHRAGRLADAERVYERILAAEPDRPDALHLLGVVALQSGRPERAVDLIGRAAERAPDDARILSNLGEAHRALGRLPVAVDCFHRALAVDPGLAGVHANLGKALADQGRPDEAVAAYRRALATDPDNADAHTDLGNALLAQGRTDDAMAAYRRALEIAPHHPKALNNLGSVLKDGGRLDEAIAFLGRAIEAGPAEAMAHFNLGLALKEARRPAEAVVALRRAVAIDPGLAEAHYVHALLHAFRPDDEALAGLEEAVAAVPLSDSSRAYLLFALGKGHDDLGRYDEAFSFFRRANRIMARDVTFDRAAHRRRMEAIKERFPAPVDPSSAGRGGPLPVFVLGVSRSGKTLVETLLASHPGVHPAGEGGQLANALKAAADRHALPDALLPVIDALDGSRIEEVGGAYMAAATVEAPGAGWFVNTAPGYVEALGLIMRGLPAARVVHCQRDPLDAGLLIYFSRYRTGNAHAYDLDDIASYVADYRSLMAHWRHLYADRILDVAYEDLVRDPAPEAARIFAFCGLEPPPPAVGEDLTTDEVGHWKHYAAHLGALRRAFETADGADD